MNKLPQLPSIHGLPRFQGKVGQVEEPTELKGKWSFYILITFMGTDYDPIDHYSQEVYDSELLAKAAMRDRVTEMCKTAQKAAGCEPTGNMVDMKTNRRINYGTLE